MRFRISMRIAVLLGALGAMGATSFTAAAPVAESGASGGAGASAGGKIAPGASASGASAARAVLSPPGRVSFRSYAADDGLTNLVITGMAEDGDGARWVATDEGLFRLDGERFVRAGLATGALPGATAGISSAHVHAIAIAPDGALCIGTPSELACGQHGRFERRLAESVSRLARSPDALWIMTTGGLMVLRAGAASPEVVRGLPERALPLLWADERGVIAGEGEILWRSTDGRRWERLALELDGSGGRAAAGGRPGASAVASEPRELVRDDSGAVWLRSATRIWRISAGETVGRDVTYQLPSSLDLRFGQTMAFSPIGELTVGTSAGLGFFRGDRWELLDGERGLPSNSAHLVFYDRGGELWVGSVGIHRRLGRGLIERHTTSTGLPGESVWAIARSQTGGLLVGTSQCLVEVIGGGGAGRPVWSCVAGTQGRVVRSIAVAPDGGVYFGGLPAELYHRSAAGDVTKVADLGTSGARQLLAVAIDADGALWLGTDIGLYWRAPGTAVVQRVTAAGGVTARFISAIVHDGPRLWVAGYEGLRVRERGAWTHLTQRNGLRATATRYLARRHDGRLCVLYDEGLGVTCFRYGGGELGELHHVDAAQGLSPLTAYSLGEDSAGRLWLGTGLGLRVIAREPAYGIDRFTTRDGIAGDDASAMAFLLDEDGGLWFGSSSGLTHVAASNYHGPIDPPGVRLLGLSLGARPLAGGGGMLESEGARTLRGAFVADSPDAASVEYQLRLLPEQPAWQPAPSRQVRYAGLAPGSYQLEVQARVNGGAWGPVTRATFSIPLAWWQARWLWGLGALLGVAVTALLVIAWQRTAMRRRTRALLAHTDASFRAFLASMPEIVIVRRGEGAVHLNEAARALFGADGERAGVWLLRSVHPADRARAVAILRSASVARRPPGVLRRSQQMAAVGRKAADGRRGWSAAGAAGGALPAVAGHELVELRVRAGDQWRELEVSHQTVSLSGAPAHILVGRDVTERRRLQAKMLMSDRMVSLGTLVAGIGHEINNPLSYVLGNLEVIDELLDGTAPVPRDELRAAVHDALDGAARVRTIVQRLSSFSRTAEQARVAVMLDDVIEQAVRLTHNELRHRAQLVLATQPVPAVVADPGQLTQVLINLLVNAAHAIAPGAADRHRITVRTRSDGDGQVILEVQDTGSGMDPQVVAHAFDPFFTTKRVGEGTGLGLSICHGIITSHGGQIAIESQLGEGTTMRITLPAHRGRRSAVVTAAVVAAAAPSVPAAAGSMAMVSMGGGEAVASGVPVIPIEAEISQPWHLPPAGEPGGAAGAALAAGVALAAAAAGGVGYDDSGRVLSGAPDTVRAVGSGGHGRPRVLVIDDEPAVGKVLARMLRAECDVIVLTDGEDALRRVTHGERFGAIVTDVMMPVLTGIELREQLHAIDPDQARRVVFITGGVFNAATAELLERPDVRCMTKPVDADALRRAVNEVAATLPSPGLAGASLPAGSTG